MLTLRLPVLALAAALAACGPGDVPDAIETAPAVEASTPDVTGRADPEETEPSDPPGLGDEAVSEAEAPVPVSEIDEGDAFVADDPMTPPPPPAPAGGLAVVNDTGMTLMYLYIAGCGESEGNDWAAMETWAYDYLGADVLGAGETVRLELMTPNCYVMRPEWEDGTYYNERVEATPGMTHYLQLEL